MAGVNAYGIPHLTGDDPLDYLDEYSLSLATGLFEPINMVLTAQAGWTLDRQTCRRVLFGAFLWWDIVVTRTGASMSMSSLGNVTDSPILAINDSAQVPAKPAFLTGTRASFTEYGIRVYSKADDADGPWTMDLTHGLPTSNLNTGDQVNIQGMVCLL